MNYIAYLSCLLFCSCSRESLNSYRTDKLSTIFIKRVEQQEPNCRVFTRGGTNLLGETKVYISFDAIRRFDLRDARRFYIQYVQQLIEMLNSDENLKSSFRQEHATIDDIDLEFGFVECTGGYAQPPYVAFVKIARGKIVYSSADETNNKWLKKTIHEETYEEAVRIVREEGYLPQP